MKNTLFKIAAALLLLSFIKKKETPKNTTDSVEMPEVEKAFKNLVTEFGAEIGKQVEKIYRLETAHFKSSQFKKTYSAGMEKFAPEFPYGWGNELRNFVKEYPEYGDGSNFSTLPFKESKTGKTKEFVKFPSLEAAIMFLGYVMKQRKNPASWYSTKPESQKRYMDSLNKIEPVIVKKITAK